MPGQNTFYHSGHLRPIKRDYIRTKRLVVSISVSPDFHLSLHSLGYEFSILLSSLRLLSLSLSIEKGREESDSNKRNSIIIPRMLRVSIFARNEIKSCLLNFKWSFPMIKNAKRENGWDWLVCGDNCKREREKYLFVVFGVVSFFVWNVSVIRNATRLSG